MAWSIFPAVQQYHGESMTWQDIGVGTAVVALGVGLFLLLPLAIAWSSGESPFGLKASPIAGAKPGRGIFCGHVEPAWSCLTSPKDHLPTVFFNTMVTDHYGKDTRTVFWRRNAIPFVLNDGTDRMIVLAGTQAHWDPGKGPLDWAAGIGQEVAIAEQENPGDVAKLLNRQLSPAPDPSEDRNETHMTDDQLRRRAVESTLRMGQLVTVIGWVGPFPDDLSSDDGVYDDGTALGLAGHAVLAPSVDGQVTVVAGSPADVRKRLNTRINAALAGVGIVALSLAYLVLFATGALG